jgi:hypothetical protein
MKKQLTYLKHKQNKIHKIFKIHGECFLSFQNCDVTSFHLLCTSLHLVSKSFKEGTYQLEDEVILEFLGAMFHSQQTSSLLCTSLH